MKKKDTKKRIKSINQKEVVAKTISLYTSVGWKKWFAKIRFWDAPYIEVEKLVPRAGNILELGCGEGMFANFMAVASAGRKVFGIDVDKHRIAQAFRGLKNTKFIYGDVTKMKISDADAVVMFHLLHHLNSSKDQDRLISKIKEKIRKKGQLIIVEVEPKFSVKYFTAWFTDHFLVPWLFEKRFYSPIYFRKSQEWGRLLGTLGFKYQITPMEKNMPFSHVVISAVKV